MDIERMRHLAGINESAEEEFAKARADKQRAEEEMWASGKGKKMEGLEAIRATAGIDPEPIIESVEEDADTFIVFEAKGSPNVIGVFRSAEDAKTVLKRYKKAVGKAYKAK